MRSVPHMVNKDWRLQTQSTAIVRQEGVEFTSQGACFVLPHRATVNQQLPILVWLNDSKYWFSSPINKEWFRLYHVPILTTITVGIIYQPGEDQRHNVIIATIETLTTKRMYCGKHEIWYMNKTADDINISNWFIVKGMFTKPDQTWYLS